MNKITLYSLIIFTQLFIINCGGGGSSSSVSEKQMFFDLPDSNINLSLSDGQDFEEEYEFIIYDSYDDEEIIYGPQPIELYNVQDNIYESKANLNTGEFTLEIRMVRVSNIDDSEESEEITRLPLQYIKNQIKVEDNKTQIDLSNMNWLEDLDEDEDGLTNIQEVNLNTDPYQKDSDGDEVFDGNDAFPLDQEESSDYDRDGIGDNSDLDGDNDGLLNTEELERGSQPFAEDSDDDGFADAEDNCLLISNSSQNNRDNDSLGDECDDDIDGDGIKNEIENERGLDPYSSDTDNDGVNDNSDAFPLNRSESSDHDDDNIGDNQDDDDDNDGLSDEIELQKGSDPLNQDSDEDGILDNVDNCLIQANQNQADLDQDGIGDTCDTDDDNDGLSDNEENTIGVDGFITQSRNIDSDGDTLPDNVDNCPNTVNANQLDTDGDEVGDECDCDDDNDQIHQRQIDNPDIESIDSNCDGIDGNKYQSIFISNNGIESVSLGNQLNPTSNLEEAVRLAQLEEASLIFEVGTYSANLIDWSSNLKMYGGYSNNFVDRSLFDENEISEIVQNETNSEKSIFTISEVDIEISGFTFRNEIESSNIQFFNLHDVNGSIIANRFITSGLNQADKEEFLIVENSTLDIRNNYISGQARSEGIGIFLSNSSGQLTNNIVTMGQGSHTRGIILEESVYDIVNNTIDGGRHENGSAYGITFTDSEVDIINNVIVTSNQRVQGSIYCDGIGELESTPVIENNLLIRLMIGNFDFPAYSGCDGNLAVNNDQLNSAREISARNNIVPENGNLEDDNAVQDYLSTFLDVDNLFEIVANSPAIQNGKNLFNHPNYPIQNDYFGASRNNQDLDIGARIFEN